jgi:hypothetical protein
MHILIGLVIAFALVAIFSNRKTRHCRWREYRDLSGAAADSTWRCVHCGLETSGHRGKEPKTCLRQTD